mmetsp:Transcript_8961/g.21287  ORF Transcript_8961/g.21287 Transcript_8961/m.21287 type:complete len:614 (+) Transcript_8961:91-1932(+)
MRCCILLCNAVVAGALSLPKVADIDADIGADAVAVCSDQTCSGISLKTSGTGAVAASGHFEDAIHKTGWDTVKVSIPHWQESEVPEVTKMYAAGLVEGLLSAEKIAQFYHNRHGELDGNEAKSNIHDAFRAQHDNIISHPHLKCVDTTLNDPECASGYWRQQGLLLAQLQGVTDGYNAALNGGSRSSLLQVGKPLQLWDIYVINIDGQIPELEQAFSESAVHAREHGASFAETDTVIERKNFRGPTTQGKRLIGRCSALVRFTGDDIFVGHTTWEDYEEMLRIYKFYDFPLKGVASRKISFSSYPAAISSTDDYYVTDAGLAVTETTTNVLGSFNGIQPEKHVPDFMHIMAATRLAKSGTHWVQLFSDTDFGAGVSGTYNSQWMVVDYNQMSSAKSFLTTTSKARGSLAPGTLHVLETYPGGFVAKDESKTLATQGYWSSFNVPVYAESRQHLGWPEERAVFVEISADAVGMDTSETLEVNEDSYTKAWRSHLFRALAPTVSSLADMRNVMQRSKPVERINGADQNIPAANFISSRYDLVSRQLVGGTDSKVVNSCLVKRMQVEAISGPSHQDSPPFDWSKFGKAPLGLPTVWNFDWHVMDEAGMEPLDAAKC